MEEKSQTRDERLSDALRTPTLLKIEVRGLGCLVVVGVCDGLSPQIRHDPETA